MNYPFFTRDRHEHAVRSFFLGISLVIAALPFAPKAAAFMPVVAAAGALFSWRRTHAMPWPSLTALLWVGLLALALGVTWLTASLPHKHARESLIVLAYVLSAATLLRSSAAMAAEDGVRIWRNVDIAIGAALILQIALNVLNMWNVFPSLSDDHLNQSTFMLCGFAGLAALQAHARDAPAWIRFRLVLLFMCAASSASLSTQVALTMAVAVYVLSRFALRFTRNAVFALSALAMLLAPAFVISYIDAVKFEPLVRQQPLTFLVRAQIWEKVSSNITFLGHGLYGSRRLSAGEMMPAITHPHNLSLAFYFDLGVIGVLLAVAALATGWRRLAVMPPAAQRAGLALFCYVFSVAQFEYTPWFEWLIGFYALLGALFVFAFSGSGAAHRHQE